MVNAHRFIIVFFIFYLLQTRFIQMKKKQNIHSFILTGQHSVLSQSKYAQEKASKSHTTFFAWLLVLSFLLQRASWALDETFWCIF